MTAISSFKPEALQGKVQWTDPETFAYDLNRPAPALLTSNKVRENLQHTPCDLDDLSPPAPVSEEELLLSFLTQLNIIPV